MSKNKKLQAVPAEPKARPSQEITQQYTAVCAELGNALLQFEIVKSRSVAAFQALNNEMQIAVQLETEAQKVKEVKGEQLVEKLAEKLVK